MPVHVSRRWIQPALPTQLVVPQREHSPAHERRHGDLPGGELAEVPLVLLPLLGVERCVSAGRGDHLTGEAQPSGGTDEEQGEERANVLTINLLVPFSPSRSCFRAALSFSLASLPFLFPFFPSPPFFFFLERWFFFGLVPPSSPVSVPAGLLWSSSAVDPRLQTDGIVTWM